MSCVRRGAANLGCSRLLGGLFACGRSLDFATTRSVSVAARGAASKGGWSRMSRAALILMALCAPLCAFERPEAAQNVIVHKEAGRFAGWPANNGIWSWGNEIVVGFKLGYLKPNDHGHAIDPAEASSLRFARSLDGGRTWKTE